MLLLPTTVVHASVGQAGIAGVEINQSTGVVSGITTSTSYVNVYAGTSSLESIDGNPPGAESTFAVTFNTVTFSGTQFRFYLSTNGYSEINTTAGETQDIPFGPIFYTANFTADCNTGCLATTGTLSGVGTVKYYQGTYSVGSTEIVSGPLPLEVSSNYKYLKIFDGTSSSVAVTKPLINILPGIKVDPSEGSAGITVSVSGGGFPTKADIAINYTYIFTSWGNVATQKNGTWILSGIVNNGGWFTHSATMLDIKQAVNPPTHGSDIYSVPITFTAVNATHLKTAFTSTAGDAVYQEWSRVIDQVSNHFDTSTTVYRSPAGGWGNDSGHTPNVPVIDVYVTSSLGIEGNYTNAGGVVKVTIGSSSVTTTSNTISGEYVINITIPNLPIGDNTVYISDNGVTYSFTIDVLSTLILSPDSGVTSGCNGVLGACPALPSNACHITTGTCVTVTAYGFTPDVSVWVYWEYPTYMDGIALNVANATTNSVGSFTTTVSFTVPSPTFGGVHYVDVIENVTTAYLGHKATIDGTYDDDVTGSAPFTVLPSLVASPTSINSNQLGFMNVYAEGLAPGVTYMVQVDHSLYSYIYGIGTCYSHFNGNGQINFTSTGFTPGVHQVEITPFGDTYEDISYYYENYTAPAAWTYFNVTTIGDYTVDAINSISSSVTTAANNAFASFSVTLDSIQTSVNALPGDITSAQTNIESAITSTQNTLAGDITASQTAIQTSISNAESTLNTAIQGVGTTAQTAASEATTAANNASAASSGSSTAQTYVLVVAVLAAITLVLELAILVRKLS